MWFQEISVPTTKKVTGHSEGRGGRDSIAKIFKGKYEANKNWIFQRGGGFKPKTFCGNVITTGIFWNNSMIAEGTTYKECDQSTSSAFKAA